MSGGTLRPPGFAGEGDTMNAARPTCLLVFATLGVALAFARPCELPGGDPKAAPAPPGGTILFSSLGPRGWDVYLTDVAGNETRRLTDHPALDFNAAFSPDGRRIAFVSERDGNLELYSIQADGTGLKRLTTEFALDDHPAWSPDGRRLAFVSTRQPADEPGRAWNGL